MGGTADGRRFLRRGAAVAEVVEHEARVAVARIEDRSFEHEPGVPGSCRHRRRIPDLEQQGFDESGDPRQLGIRRLERHQRIATIDHEAFGRGTNQNRDAAAVVADDPPPTVDIQLRLGKVPAVDGLRFSDVGVGDAYAFEVALEAVLQAEPQRLRMPVAAA